MHDGYSSATEQKTYAQRIAAMFSANTQLPISFHPLKMLKPQAHASHKIPTSRLKLIQSIFFICTLLSSTDVFSQEYLCKKDKSCRYIGLHEIRNQMLRYTELYTRYGVKIETQSTLARNEETIASDGCVICGTGIQLTKIKVSGVDSRVDENGVIRPDVKLNAEEEIKYNGVGTLVCDSRDIGGTVNTGTATLVRKGNGFIFLGAAHIIIPAADEKKFSDFQMTERFKEYSTMCDVILRDSGGNEFQRFRLDPARVRVGSYKPTLNVSGDYLVFNAIPMDADGNDKPINPNLRLITTNIREHIDYTKFIYGYIVAYHKDLKPYGEKIKSHGTVKEFPANSKFAGVDGAVGHDIDTSGASSGALIRNEAGEAYAIHIGGTISTMAEADWINNANYALDINQKIINAVNSI